MADNSALPLLYSYRRCPYAMRARLAMLQANRRFQTFEIVMRDKPAELLALSPKGTVPVLHLTDGGVLEESLDIMQWAFEERDPEGWWSRGQSDDNLALLRTKAAPKPPRKQETRDSVKGTVYTLQSHWNSLAIR